VRPFGRRSPSAANQSHVLGDQVVALDRSRLGRVTGTLSPGELEGIDRALRFVLGLL